MILEGFVDHEDNFNTRYEEFKPRAKLDFKESNAKMKPNERTPLLNLITPSTNPGPGKQVNREKMPILIFAT